MLGGGAYINHRGLRYPRLSFEPRPLSLSRDNPVASLSLQNFIFTDNGEAEAIGIRAIAPEAQLAVTPSSSPLTISINNIAHNSVLRISGSATAQISEDITGINRTLLISNGQKKDIVLKWALPQNDEATFAVIGDSGGGDELGWCIRRASQLGANFLLHLGDFNYGKGEYEAAINQFHNSPIPVFVTIGNHDFNDSGLVYHKFREQIGPMNNAFSIAGCRFTNIDSAASRFPVYAGHRAQLIKQLKKTQQDFSDQVFFTHKPFEDTRAGEDHTMSGIGEIDWVHDNMLDLGVNDLLCGHVHRSTEIEFDGIRQWTSGEGLGFEDIRYQQQVARLLMADVQRGAKINYRWEPLNMPWHLHTSPTHLPKLRKRGLLEQLEWFEQLMQSQNFTARSS